MREESIYIQNVKKIIQSYDKDIKEINDLEFVKILDYSDENVKIVDELIINKKMNDFAKLYADSSIEENLIIMRFENKDGRLQYVTIYDNEELWQNPIVIKVYPSA